MLSLELEIISYSVSIPQIRWLHPIVAKVTRAVNTLKGLGNIGQEMELKLSLGLTSLSKA